MPRIIQAVLLFTLGIALSFVFYRMGYIDATRIRDKQWQECLNKINYGGTCTITEAGK